MIIKGKKKAVCTVFILICAGASAGFLNGLLGAGGGILLVWTLNALNPDRSPEGVRNNFAAASVCIIPLTALSAYLYAADGHYPETDLLFLLLPAVFGGVLGAVLLDRIRTDLLKKIFSILTAAAGLGMLLR